MKYIATLAIASALLCGCGGASKATQIESLLIQPADVPTGDTVGPVQTSAQSMVMYFDLPPNKEMRHQELLRDGKRDGWTTVFLYPSASDEKGAYDKLVDGIGSLGHPVAGLGEQAIADDPTTDGHSADIVFVRCHAVVNMLVNASTPQAAADIAKRLDQRLTPILCQ